MRQSRTLVLSLGLISAFLWQEPLLADPRSEKPCETLYAELLAKARKSLQAERPDEAVQFLLDAAAVAEYCANVSEKPQPQRQEEKEVLQA